MLNPKLLSQIKAKGRQVAAVPRPLVEIRSQLIALIDDYWRYYCNPTEYSYRQKLINPETGKIEEVFNVGRWRDSHHIVHSEEGQTVISIMWNGHLLPLTRKGDQELVIQICSRVGTRRRVTVLSTSSSTKSRRIRRGSLFRMAAGTPRTT